MFRKLPIALSRSSGLLKTSRRQFFFKTEGDYDFGAPLLNAACWAGAGATLFGAWIGYQMASNKTQQDHSNANDNSQNKTLSIPTKGIK